MPYHTGLLVGCLGLTLQGAQLKSIALPLAAEVWAGVKSQNRQGQRAAHSFSQRAGRVLS